MIRLKQWPLRNLLRTGFAGGLALAITGCISLSPEPPVSLLSLTADKSVQAGSEHSGTAENSIKILDLAAPQALNVTRVPVHIDETEIAYLKDAVWVERPTRLFRRLLAETIRAQTGRFVVDGEDPGMISKTQLRGTLLDFGYDVRSSSVIVRFDATRAVDGNTVETKRFESIQTGVLAEAAPVGAALNRGANDVASQVADWIK